MDKHRLYVDEVGNPDLESSANPNHRFLSLTGVALSLEYIRAYAFPQMEAIKEKYFASHPDDPVIFHRKEMSRRSGSFWPLRNPEIEEKFNRELLDYLTITEYRAFTIVIDKSEFLDKYRVWHQDPYHYCLKVLVERYVMWLSREGKSGDVMAESRGGKEDRRLKDSYSRIYDQGTDFVGSDRFQKVLTSKQLHVKPKMNNITGLQIADMIAHPSSRTMIDERTKVNKLGSFGRKIVEILRNSKYDRGANGAIVGYGQKWLP